jgi:hypothetical protein
VKHLAKTHFPIMRSMTTRFGVDGIRGERV